MTSTRRMQIVIGLLIALGLPFCHLGNLGKAYSGLGPRFGGEVLWWLLFVVILVYVLRVEREPLASIGYRAPGWANIGLGFAFAIVAVVGIGVIAAVVLPALHMPVKAQITSLFQEPFWFRVLLVTRAAFVEETAFRGYGFERLTELSGSTWAAAIVTCGLFTAAHYAGGGLGQVLIALWGGVVLTVLYVWRRNIWAAILCHWLTDAAGFLLVPMSGAHHH